MKTMTVANFKAQFSAVIDGLHHGEEVLIEYGKAHRKLGVIIPYEKYKPIKRKIGILKHKSNFEICNDFKISDDELLSL